MQKYKEDLNNLDYNPEISNLQWAPWAKVMNRHGKPKTKSEIIIRTEDVTVVNRLSVGGMPIFGEVFDTEKYERKNVIMQCMSCAGLAHAARDCHRDPRCGYCAGGHNTKEHNRTAHGKAQACVHCKATDHNSFDNQKGKFRNKRSETLIIKRKGGGLHQIPKKLTTVLPPNPQGHWQDHRRSQ